MIYYFIAMCMYASIPCCFSGLYLANDMQTSHLNQLNEERARLDRNAFDGLFFETIIDRDVKF